MSDPYMNHIFNLLSWVMAMSVITFFNNKRDVGKTAMVYHVAWMLAELNYKVLAADLDPQSNLSSMFLDQERKRTQIVLDC